MNRVSQSKFIIIFLVYRIHCVAPMTVKLPHKDPFSMTLWKEELVAYLYKSNFQTFGSGQNA